MESSQVASSVEIWIILTPLLNTNTSINLINIIGLSPGAIKMSKLIQITAIPFFTILMGIRVLGIPLPPDLTSQVPLENTMEANTNENQKEPISVMEFKMDYVINKLEEKINSLSNIDQRMSNVVDKLDTILDNLDNLLPPLKSNHLDNLDNLDLEAGDKDSSDSDELQSISTISVEEQLTRSDFFENKYNIPLLKSLTVLGQGDQIIYDEIPEDLYIEKDPIHVFHTGQPLLEQLIKATKPIPELALGDLQVSQVNKEQLLKPETENTLTPEIGQNILIIEEIPPQLASAQPIPTPAISPSTDLNGEPKKSATDFGQLAQNDLETSISEEESSSSSSSSESGAEDVMAADPSHGVGVDDEALGGESLTDVAILDNPYLLNAKE